ncbi:Nucleotide-binding universal stress protein, UspA family [Nitrosomonas marina]|uniref:Nucleotide-binding universal stress protein, UspA family n=1 Tax=Nitrosomonas marina TaxID=917 RepID=A0A1I0FMK4_9PROT|nr:universal stress protein [Nitrosomonas marina]SET58717.1 Nucleotide-binding universal stress protein, UspA family [Nitrosomonas marina]
MYKKIVVAVDGSETAQQALGEAENIAKTYNAELRIVHAIVLTMGGDLEADKKTGQNIIDHAKSIVKLPNVETQLLISESGFGLIGIIETIAAAVADWDADLVVVGTANRRGLKRFLIGSVAEQLITQVDASILLVRPTKT